MSTPRSRTTRSKAQLKNDFDNLQEQASGRDELDPTAAIAAEKRRADVMADTKDVDPATIVNKITKLGLDVQTSLDHLKNTLTGGAAQLATVREAIKYAEHDLEQLHGKEIAASSLADLIAEHKERERVFNENMANNQAEFDAKVSAQKNAETERRAAVEKERRREEDEYQYATAQRRREEADAYQQKKIELERALTDAAAQKSKEWAAREDALKTKEAAYAEALKRIENLPAEIAAEVKKATDAQARAMSSEFAHKTALAEAQAKSDKALADAQIKALTQKVVDQDAVIGALQNKLEAAEKRVESIANNALQSASGRQALEAASNMAATLKTDGSRKG